MNIGNKTIVGIKWAYFFDPKDAAREGMSYLFITKTNIAPGKEKLLSELLSRTGSKSPIKLPSKQNREGFSERAVILALEYADGTTWVSR